MGAACVSLEPFALQVLDDTMSPELPSGTILVVDPGEPVKDECMVVIEHEETVMLRRVRLEPATGEGGLPRFVAPGRPDIVPGNDWRRCVRGVVTGVRRPR